MGQKSKIIRYLSVLAIIFLTALAFEMTGGQANRGQESVPNVCQTDYTKITYSDGFYYYQSAADRYYLYRSDESGENRECLAKQVPQEIYVMGDWVYFTNLTQGSQLFKIRTDGSGMELVCGERIKRFLPMEGKFYCLSETENGGRIFSCTQEGETKNLFEGKCNWLCTDGELLYFETDNPEWADGMNLAENAQEEAKSHTVAIDGEGMIKEKYGTVLEKLFSTEKYLYYCESREAGNEYINEIVRLDRQAGSLKRYRLPDISISWWRDISYAVCHGKVYVFMYDRYTPAYHIFQYREEAEEFEKICPQGKIEGRSTFYSKAEGIHLVNDRIFLKSYEGEGFGQLWHVLDISGGEETLFEGMEKPVAVATMGIDWGRSREGYVEQDIEYSGEREDGQGFIMATDLTLPRIGGEVPAADVINGKIRRDAEQLYEEQLAFHETEEVQEAIVNAGGDTSGGSLYCCWAYAAERYVSIVYKKQLYAYSGIRYKEYVTRLYSSETGEELQPRDLFAADWEEASLRLSYLIRRTEMGIDYCDGYLFSLDEKKDKVFYCLTENGLEVFWEETWVEYAEPQFIIPYEELEDIWAY
ncbi:MAG: DUF5050 domain-containing protein [Butyrivibrio sp.]|nr:DUF5050 domain-containing protein [Muribaculum sp.]MCM1552168.1 DUF5050 domain-containing protein [Butyrivibrio sp.]